MITIPHAMFLIPSGEKSSSSMQDTSHGIVVGDLG
jgi:hypothetical protein